MDMLLSAYDHLKKEIPNFSANGSDGQVQFWINKQHKIHMQMATCVISTNKSIDQILSELISLYKDHSISITNSTLSKWDNGLGETEILHQDNNHNIVIHTKYISPTKMIKNRDFVFAGKRFQESNDKMTYIMKSVDHEDSITKNYIRGTVMTNAWICQKLGPNSILFTYIVQVNPNGNIPASLVNVACHDRVKWIHHMKKYMEL